MLHRSNSAWQASRAACANEDAANSPLTESAAQMNQKLPIQQSLTNQDKAANTKNQPALVTITQSINHIATQPHHTPLGEARALPSLLTWSMVAATHWWCAYCLPQVAEAATPWVCTS